MSNYLFYIKKRLSGQTGIRLLNTIVSSMALTLLCIVVITPQILLHCENTIKKALGDDLSKYGVVCNGRNAISDENIFDYINEIYNSPEIESVGTWDYGAFAHMTTVNAGTDYWNQILDIQNSHVKELGEDNNYVQFVYMLSQAFHINNLELYQGSTEQIGKNTGYLMYLGYNFKDIPVGTVFAHETYDFSYEVAGILKKNTSIVDEMVLIENVKELKFSCSIAIDNMIIVIPPCSDNYHSEAYFFKCSDGYTYEEAAAKIKSISDKYNIQTETGTLEYRIDTVLSYFNWTLNTIAKLSGLLVFSTFIILLTAQLLTILFRKEELGVWIIAGVDRKKIFLILLGENLMKMLISSLIAFGMVVFLEYLFIFSQSTAIAYEFRYILWGNLPVSILLCAGLIALMCSIIPIIYVRNKSIPEIIRGTWD